MQLTPEQYKEFNEGRFELHMPEIRLAEATETNPLEFVGPGAVTIDNDRTLRFRIYHSGTPRDVVRHLDRTFRWTPGQIVPDSDYFSFHGRDLSGTQWKSSRVDANIHTGPSGDVVVEGKLHFLETTDTRGKGDPFVRVEALQRIDIAATDLTTTQTTDGVSTSSSSRRDSASVQVKDWSFRVRATPTMFSVSGKGGSMPPDVLLRLRETFEFVIGENVHFSFSEMRDQTGCTTTLWSRWRNAVRGTPPIGWTLPPDEFWELFRRYAEYVWEIPAQQAHPLSVWLHEVRSASTSPLSPLARGLTLGVAVEGVLSECFFDGYKVEESTLEAITAIEGHVKSWSGSQRMKDRVLGAIGPMRKVRAKDRLASLRDAGVISSRDYGAWDKLRNKAAHATLPNESELQDWLDLSSKVEVGLFRLVFHLIGYRGKHRDYGAPGWPEVEYPLGTAESTSDGTPGSK